MDSIAVCSVNDMPSAEKQSIESLVGRQLEDNQQVFIMAFTPGVAPSDKARAGANGGTIEDLGKGRAARADTWRHGRRIDAAVDEAVDHVRHRKD